MKCTVGFSIQCCFYELHWKKYVDGKRALGKTAVNGFVSIRFDFAFCIVAKNAFLLENKVRNPKLST